MSEQVIFIFKTLIKIPVYTLIVYIVFNCFAFGGAYFKMLGASHAIEMMVIEDNFLTQTNREIIAPNGTEAYGNANSFVGSLVTGITPRVTVIDCVEGDDPLNDNSIACSAEIDNRIDVIGNVDATTVRVRHSEDTNRTQFGTMRTCGIIWQYQFILPLVPHRAVSEGQDAVGGWDRFNNGGGDSYLDIDEATADNLRRNQIGTFNIEFLYHIPGMKYYADLG